jgi:hypothetical protein
MPCGSATRFVNSNTFEADATKARRAVVYVAAIHLQGEDNRPKARDYPSDTSVIMVTKAPETNADAFSLLTERGASSAT